MAVALAPGTEFAGHRIEALLGKGGMGLVYRATQLSLERPVALKLIVPEYAGDILFRERFKREARLAARIDHPNALPVFEAGEAEGMLFLTMRYVDGTDLEAMIAGEGALGPELAAAIVGQVGAALDAAHAVGLVHRDVKPANVLVERGPGGEAHAWLTDFGLTKQVGSASGLTKTSMWVGTVDYAAPEQIQSMTVDARADVYALGCVLFQALTGRVPFPREREVSKIMAHASEPPPSVTDVLPAAPAAFNGIVQRAMAKDPGERHQSAGELGRAALNAAGVTGGVKLEGRFLQAAPARRDADRGAPTVG